MLCWKRNIKKAKCWSSIYSSATIHRSLESLICIYYTVVITHKWQLNLLYDSLLVFSAKTFSDWVVVSLVNGVFLFLHARANLAVSPLPEHAMLLLHVTLLDVVVRTKISVCKREKQSSSNKILKT